MAIEIKVHVEASVLTALSIAAIQIYAHKVLNEGKIIEERAEEILSQRILEIPEQYRGHIERFYGPGDYDNCNPVDFVPQFISEIDNVYDGKDSDTFVIDVMNLGLGYKYGHQSITKQNYLIEIYRGGDNIG